MPEGGPVLSVVPGGAASNSGRITVVGVLGDSLESLDADARRALAGASRVAGTGRHLDAWRAWLGRSSAKEVGARSVPTIEADADVLAFADQVARRAVEHTEDVCVIASGDPGFFGVLGALLRVVERSRLHVFPAPSSVAVAFARVGLPWEDAVVVSLAGRDPEEVVRVLRVARKAAVLTTAEWPPQTLGRALLEGGTSTDMVVVCSRLCCPDERVVEVSLEELAHGAFDPMSVVLLVGPGGLQTMGWEEAGSSDADEPMALYPGFYPDLLQSTTPETGDASEVLDIARAKLALAPTGVLWDLSDADGSVAVDAAVARPGMTVFAVAQGEPSAAVADRASARGVAVHVVAGRDRSALERLPDPDRVLLGAASEDVLDVVVRRLRPGGRIVSITGSVDRATAHANLLGAMVQVSTARGARDPDGGWRLGAADPVFIVWGPVTDLPTARP